MEPTLVNSLPRVNSLKRPDGDKLILFLHTYLFKLNHFQIYGVSETAQYSVHAQGLDRF